MVPEFVYLGSVISPSGKPDADIYSRIQKTWSAFGRFWSKLFKRKDLNLETRIQLYQAMCLSILTYGASSWILRKQNARRIDNLIFRQLTMLLGYTWRDGKSYVDILQEAGIAPLEVTMA